MGEVKVFLDTSVLFAAVWSETGGSRLILKLGEAGVIALWIGPWVLREADAVLARKSEESRGLLALLLDRAGVEVGTEATGETPERARQVIEYLPDAQVLAEAMELRVDYLVSLDRKHIVGNLRAEELPFRIGTPGEFLEWYRGELNEGQ